MHYWTKNFKKRGFESISASQLSRKNNEINPAILSNLFLDLVSKILHWRCCLKFKMYLRNASDSQGIMNNNGSFFIKFIIQINFFNVRRQLIYCFTSEEDHPIIIDTNNKTIKIIMVETIFFKEKQV